MHLGGIGLIVDQILTAHRIVLAPMEVKLFELIVSLTGQGSASHTRLHALGKLHVNQHSVSIVGHGEALWCHVEINVLNFGKIPLLHIVLIDINGTLEFATAALEILLPVLRTVLSPIAEVLARSEGNNCNNGYKCEWIRDRFGVVVGLTSNRKLANCFGQSVSRAAVGDTRFHL